MEENSGIPSTGFLAIVVTDIFLAELEAVNYFYRRKKACYHRPRTVLITSES